jgi:hypothetical protein
MRSITKLAPVDPATTSARRIIEKVEHWRVKSLLREIEERVAEKCGHSQREADAHR